MISTPLPTSVRLVCLSDTHGLHRSVIIPDGDVLIHAGDCSVWETSLATLKDFNAWLGELPHRHKIIIAGNHDIAFVRQAKEARKAITNALYLENSGVDRLGLHFWGSPITPVQGDMAFATQYGGPSRKIWKQIPANTDVLITHGPPFGTCDQVNGLGPHLGCRDLTETVVRVQPRLHIYGHIHGGYGQEENRRGTRFVNCALLDQDSKQLRQPVVIDLVLRQNATAA